MNSVALVGCTGLVGSQILSALRSIPQKPTIHAIARREIAHDSPNIKLIIKPETGNWPTSLRTLTPVPDAFLSALGTSRAQAGSFAAQRSIDFDLNLSLAKAAKEAGVKTFVLISSAAVSASSRLPYQKMKGELEDAVKALDIPHTVIVKPGLLVGTRQDIRLVEAVLRTAAKALGTISKSWLVDPWAVDVDVVGRAAVAAALECSEGKREKGVWILSQSEIFRLGRQEPK
ncbi:MAG: hypothetical protein Q9201_001412 [Fulgogasparrea decipioides]